MSTERPVTDDDLHSYADHMLAPALRAEVSDHLERNPDASRRVEEIVAQNTALRAAAAHLLQQSVPRNLGVARFFEDKRAPVRLGFRLPPAVSWSQIAAALIGAFVLGGAGGWSLRPSSGPLRDGVRPLVEEAADSYAVYEPDRLHPVEIGASNRDDLMSWVSARLRRPVSAPEKIAGYHLLGGRVVATSRGPAAMFMYDDGHGKRVVMMVCPLSLHGTSPIEDSAPSGLAGLSWSDRGVGYSLVGAMSASQLHALGETVRRQTSDKA